MGVTTSRVQKIMRGSAFARNITSVLIGLWAVVLVFVSITVAMGGIAGQPVGVGPYVFPSAALEPWTARIYIIVMWLAGGGLAMAALLLIRGVFADLARGNIFCDANVRRIRNLGWLTIAGGICQWLIPIANAKYFMLTGHDYLTYRGEPPLFSGLGEIINGGLLILLSWIMAVGLGVREDAEELQRDAELVI